MKAAGEMLVFKALRYKRQESGGRRVREKRKKGGRQKKRERGKKRTTPRAPELLNERMPLPLLIRTEADRP